MISQLARSAMLGLGLTMGRKAPDSRILNVLDLLKPVKTRFELVRLGGDSDGGYLVPNDLQGISACFSPGVSDTASFEEAMIEREVPCFLADASVKGSPFLHNLIDFEPMFLDASDSAETMTLRTWVDAKSDPTDCNLLLQMDIEGHEWPVLLDASPELLNRFRIIVIELHHLDRIFDAAFLSIIGSCLKKLGAIFHVVHCHPNNASGLLTHGDISVPPLLEVTFLRRDRSEDFGSVSDFPHPLDQANLPELPDLILPHTLRG